MVEVAHSLRVRAQLSRPAFSTRAIVDASFPDAVVTGHDLPVGVDEAVTRTDEGIVILYRRGLSSPEQRFAIAHAVGHLLYDHVTAKKVSEAFRERRADRFASELLVPLYELARVLEVLPSKNPDEQRIYLDHVDQLASYFNVPAMLVRSRIRDVVMSSH